jgi:spore germination cell wall hydrolase CwlJ-like protein
MRALIITIVMMGILFIINDLSNASTIDEMQYLVQLDTVEVIAKPIVVSDSDLDILARLIYSEAASESFEGKRAVADVVVNIANYEGWSIAKTIFDPGRFDGIHTKYFYKRPDKGSIQAAKMALMGKHILPKGVMFYHNPKIATDRKWVNYIEKYPYRMIGNHFFCYHPDFYFEDVERSPNEVVLFSYKDFEKRYTMN